MLYLRSKLGPAIDIYSNAVKTFFDRWEGYTYATNKMRGWYGQTKQQLHASLKALNRYNAYKAKIETDEKGKRLLDPDSVRGDQVGIFDLSQVGYATPDRR